MSHRHNATRSTFVMYIKFQDNTSYIWTAELWKLTAWSHLNLSENIKGMGGLSGKWKQWFSLMDWFTVTRKIPQRELTCWVSYAWTKYIILIGQNLCLFLYFLSIIADVALNLKSLLLKRKSPNSKTDSDWPPRIIGCQLIWQDLVVIFTRACKNNTENKQLWQWLFEPAGWHTLIILLPTEATEGLLHVLGNIPKISRLNQQKLCLENFFDRAIPLREVSPHAVTMWEMSEVCEVFPHGLRLGMYAGCRVSRFDSISYRIVRSIIEVLIDN